LNRARLGSKLSGFFKAQQCAQQIQISGIVSLAMFTKFWSKMFGNRDSVGSGMQVLINQLWVPTPSQPRGLSYDKFISSTMKNARFYAHASFIFAWFFGLTDCGTPAQGYDLATVAQGYDLATVAQGYDLATVAQGYDLATVATILVDTELVQVQR
jgi:hypothetical protein